MNPELLIRMLMKFMGVSEDQMRSVFENGQSLVIDGKKKIDSIDARLARIEKALGVNDNPEMKAIENGNHERD